jgi:cardiolipin synthase
MDALLPLPWNYILAIVTTMGGYLLAFILIPRLLLDRRGPEATLSWILIIAFLPYLGAFLYYAFGRTRIRRRARRRQRYHFVFRNSLDRLPEPAVYKAEPAAVPLVKEAREIAKLAAKLTDTPLVPGNGLEVFISGPTAYNRMEQAIVSARHHVHLMSYIMRTDQTGHYFRDLLAQKAREGVQVRLLLDGFGAYPINGAFIRPLVEAGGHFAMFAPIFSRLSHWRPHLRNHRKILVVDGHIGFTGGLNIGDEYQGRKRRHAPWRDTHLSIQGPAVRYLQEIFSEDWFYATEEDLAEPEYFPVQPPQGPDLVQVIGSGPDYDAETIHRVFFTAINEARNRIHITTPYFIPDPAMLLALKSAAWRGLDVRLLLPGQSDLKLVQLAGRSYYRELLEAGVRIYEHRPGILHAKTMVVDGVWSTVGSANMDTRSFKLNFEVNIMVWGEAFATRMEEIYRQDISDSQRVSLADLDAKPRWAHLAEGVSRVLSPVL